MRFLRSGALFMISVGAVLASAPDFLPLENGNQWTYRAADSNETLTISVGTPVMIGGHEYYKLRGYAAMLLLVRHDGNGNLFWYDEDRGIDVLLTSFEPVENGWYDTFLDGCEQGGQPQTQRVQTRVPAGGFNSALEIKYRSYACRDRGIEQELYLDNVGLLQRTITTIAGPRTFDLMYARVGALRINAQPGTAFRVSADGSVVTRNDPNEVVTQPISLRLTVDRSDPIPLRYNTSQKFEVQIRNEAGEIVCKWSDDAAYAQPIADQKAFEIEHRLDLPLRMRSGEALPDGTYTIEGWLTTEERQFSAATALRIITGQ
jgi:hypothetical protein